MVKNILITGASTGFGRDTAEMLAVYGHNVFASMRDPEARNRAHANVLRGKNIEVVELDVTDTHSVDAAVAEVIAKAGRIDVLINNAGVLVAGVSEAFTPEQALGNLLAGPIDILFDWVAQSPPAPDLEATIVNIDLAHTVATARVEIIGWLGHRFTDQFTLLKENGAWTITAKVFHTH